MNLKRVFMISMILLLAMPAMGVCFEVKARVDKTQISMEDSVFLTVEVKGGKADLDLSMIKDFKVTSRGRSSNSSYINGVFESKAGYNFVLTPLSTGELKIPAIMASRDGETGFTREIVIHVAEKTMTPDKARALFAKSHVTNARLFVGEQSVYTLKFFTSQRLSRIGFERPPGFNGISAKSFEKEKTYTQTINGTLYQVTQVNYLITPTSPGTFNIDPAVLIANVMIKSKQDPFFNDSFFSSNNVRPVRVTSNPVKIEVSPLPSPPGNLGFSGLVGRFDIDGNMDKTRLKAGESVTFTIKISGSGNIMDASLPETHLNDPAFKVYDDTPSETIHLTESGYEGVKIFKRAIVVVNPGSYVIKPIDLIYFDVDQRAYQTVSTQEIRLEVTPSETLHKAVKPLNPLDTAIVKQEVSLVNNDILELKEGLTVLENYREISPFLFALWVLIPGVLFSGVKLFTLFSKRDVPIEKQMEEKAKRHLKQAGKMAVQDQGFLTHLYSGLVARILARGKKKGETITIREAQTILTNAGVEDGKIDQVTHVLETIESIRFGGLPMDENKARGLLSRTKQMMKLLSLALVCLWGVSLVPQNAMANSTRTFIDGIKQYRAGDFKQAANAFEAVAKTPIKNPYLFYNIANAYLKADDIGQAILWYERAKIMAPNDPDLNFNLAYANTLVKDKKEDVMTIMDVLFFWESLVPMKTIQITAIFFSFVFFAWAALKVIKKQNIFSGMGIILCTLFVLVTAVTCVNYYQRSVRMTAVIVQNEVMVRSGVTDTSTTLFSLHAGTRVRIEEQRDGYLKVWFSKGKVGWVKTKQALII